MNRMEEIVFKSDSPYCFIVENTWLPRHILYFDFGWGNGYVALPKSHPWYRKHYDNIEDVQINGGLTFSEMINEMWVVGFDTAHSFDTLARWPKEAVQTEADCLLFQALSAQ